MSYRGGPRASTSRLPEVPPVISTTRKLRKRPSSKGKERASAAETTTVDEEDSADEWKPPSDEEQRKKNKGKGKQVQRKEKRVRIASPSSDDSDQQQEDFVSLSPSPTSTGRRRLRGADDSTDDDDQLNPDDYWDPRVLPINGAQRRTRELRKLEHGLYRSALYDTAINEMDLGRILLEWEAIKRRRRAEEEEQQEQVEALEGTRVEQLARPRTTRSRSGTPAAFTDREDTPGVPSAHLDNSSVLPFPSALSLDLLSRWPLNPAAKEDPTNTEHTLSDSLWSLVSSTTHHLQRLNPALRKPPRPPPRTRSAYEINAPLAPPSTLVQINDSTHTNGNVDGYNDLEDSDSNFDSEDGLNSGDDDLDPSAPSTAQANTFHQLSTSLDTLLMSMVEKIPLGPPPPLDYYTQQKIKSSRPSEMAVGWESVLEVVQKMDGVPASVVEQLEQRLISVFGPPRDATPPPADDVNSSTSPPAPGASGGKRKRAKSAPAVSSKKSKGKRGADGTVECGPRKKVRRGKARAQPSIDISPAFVDNSDVDMPSIEEHLPPLPDLPPLPELPPLPVLEEYRRGLYASSSAVSEP